MTYNSALARGTARIAGLAWLVASFHLALRNGSHLTTRAIGGGVVAGCGRVFASQLPQREGPARSLPHGSSRPCCSPARSPGTA
jgi:hypothetical protein